MVNVGLLTLKGESFCIDCRLGRELVLCGIKGPRDGDVYFEVFNFGKTSGDRVALRE